MLCLVLWGGALERRIGSFYFLVIYLCAMIAGAIVSDLHHSQPYLAVGASGAISGILGALLCLWILGKIDLSAQFFLTNIGLNAAIALSVPRIDWVAHLGGFTAGLIACALIDILERANRFAFRCKFPEFVKVNGAIVVVMLGALVWSNTRNTAASGGSEGWFLLLAYSASCLVAVKLIDLGLTLKSGLAVVVVTFSVANAGLILLGAKMAVRSPGPNCAWLQLGAEGLVQALVDLACASSQATIDIIAACAFAATLLLYSRELMRGIKDVGFIGTSLRADRKRSQGI
jgi:rhomboid protease GluP